MAKIVEKAKSGDATAAKILLDRLVPVPRTRTVALTLPSMADGYSRSKAAALVSVLDAVSAGNIAPDEAAIIAELVEKVGAASQNCGGLLPPPPLTKEQRGHVLSAEGWPKLKPWPLDLK